MIAEILLVLGSYLLGSVPTGVIVGRLRGFDPRAVGSGNIGASNIARAGGASAAVITLIGDALKGAIPVIVVRAAGFPVSTIAAAALAAFIGSICSVFLGFKGGKGVACGLGIWIAISPLVILIPLAVFGIVFAFSRIMSPSSISAAIALPLTVAAFGLPRDYLILAILMTALVLFRFRENIRRLSRGEEPRFQPKRNSAAS